MSAYRRLNPSAFYRRNLRTPAPRKPAGKAVLVDKRSLPETLNLVTAEHAPRYTVERSEGKERLWFVADGETNLTVAGPSPDVAVMRERARTLNERDAARKGAR
jgi:hypothetical protein